MTINYVLIGLPGAGKGTLSQTLSEKEYVKIASGDLLRAETQRRAHLEMTIQERIDTGEFLPDSLVFGLVSAQLFEVAHRNIPFILDGFPRTVSQYEMLQEFLTKNNLQVRYVFISIDESIALKRMAARLTCWGCKYVFNQETNPPRIEGTCDFCLNTLFRRPEDIILIAKKRIREFQEKTYPILAHIPLDSLIKIDGNLPIENIKKEFEKLKIAD